MHINNIKEIHEHLHDEPLALFFITNPDKRDKHNVLYNFSIMASNLIGTLPRSPERTVMLRHLLEARDSAERCITLADTAYVAREYAKKLIADPVQTNT